MEDKRLGIIAVMTDSNSGITQEQGLGLGVYVVPMPFIIDGNMYYEDINMTRDEFYGALDNGADVSTSQPSPEDVMTMWDKALESNDEVIYIPMSSGLSGSFQTAAILSDEDKYRDKVFVLDNQRISVTQRRSVLDAKEMADCGKYTAKQIRDMLYEKKFESSIYIMLDTLKYLKKGGRITPAAAAIGTILKIKPVLQIQGEKLDAFTKVKTMKQAKSAMIKAVQKDIETRFSGSADDLYFNIAHTENLEEAEKFAAEVKKEFHCENIYIDHLSLSISCHIGRGSLALAVSKKVNY